MKEKTETGNFSIPRKAGILAFFCAFIILLFGCTTPKYPPISLQETKVVEFKTLSEPNKIFHSHQLKEIVEQGIDPTQSKVLSQSEEYLEKEQIKLTRLLWHSQTWLTPDKVTPNTWVHEVFILQPSKVIPNQPYILFLGEGDTKNVPSQPKSELMELARQTNLIVVELKQIPMQPLRFEGEEKDRFEDNVTAYCWAKFLETQDPEWIPSIPSLRTVKTLLDLIEQKSPDLLGQKLKDVYVTGISKRAWLTWLTPVVDDRVKAIAPINIDLLNTKISMKHHFQTFKGWSFAIREYNQHGIFSQIDSPRFTSLTNLIDPLSHNERLAKIPKLILNAANDPFFLPESSLFYWDKLLGPKLLRYAPNTSHYLPGFYRSISFGVKPTEDLISFFGGISQGKTFPNLSWEKNKDEEICLYWKDLPPKKLTYWQASSENGDFRAWPITDSIVLYAWLWYHSMNDFPHYVPMEEVVNLSGNSRCVSLIPSSKPNRAYFIEAEFSGNPNPLTYTTSVFVDREGSPQF